MKQITHERAYQCVQNIEPKKDIEYHRVLKWVSKNEIDTLKDYITQQEKKDKLLELYQSLYYQKCIDFRITKQNIKSLEEELK